MPGDWNARQPRLLQTILTHFNLDRNVLIKAYNSDWKGVDELTRRAYDQYAPKLMLNDGAKGVRTTAAPKTPIKTGVASTPRTPATKSSVPKTPASSAKKRKVGALSDDEEPAANDDEGEESEVDFTTNLPLRQPSSRRSKATRKSYQESDDEDDGMSDNESAPADSAEPLDMFSHELNFDGTADIRTPQKSNSLAGYNAVVTNGVDGTPSKKRRSAIGDRLRRFNDDNDGDGEWMPTDSL